MLTKIKMLRLKRNIPQFQVARALHISTSKLCQLESGRYYSSARLCEDVCLHYELPLEDYFDFFPGYAEMKGQAKFEENEPRLKS